MITEEKDQGKLLDDWNAIVWRMNERGIDPQTLARKTGYLLTRIWAGVKGEPAPITLGFLQKCVVSFGLSDCREYDGHAIESLNHDACMALIKPPPAMPPYKGNFWDHEDER